MDSELDKSREDFIVHFKNTCSDAYLPAWIIVEILPLGNVCWICKDLRGSKLKKENSQSVRFTIASFWVWIMVIGGLRNACYHHNCLGPRSFPLRVLLPINTQFTRFVNPSSVDVASLFSSLYNTIFIVSCFSSQFIQRQISRFIEKVPLCGYLCNGICRYNWLSEPLWKTKSKHDVRGLFLLGEMTNDNKSGYNTLYGGGLERALRLFLKLVGKSFGINNQSLIFAALRVCAVVIV